MILEALEMRVGRGRNDCSHIFYFSLVDSGWKELTELQGHLEPVGGLVAGLSQLLALWLL